MNVVIYARISYKDEEESTSIKNQIELCSSFIKLNNWNLVKTYIDDGYSGTNFIRPGIKSLLKDASNNLFDIVISKDVSRLGRDYLKVGELLDHFFIKHHIRFIGINDGVDTSNKEDDFLPIRNIFNEMYAKDISKKIRFSLNAMMKEGVNSRARQPIYGYRYNENEERIIDPYSSSIVRRIFILSLTNSCSEIAKKLTEEKVLTPTSYYSNKHSYKWSRSSIYRILKNDEYLGNYRRHKTSKPFKSLTRLKIEKEDQYLFESKYEPIISDELFFRVQEKLTKEKVVNPYLNILFCNKCKHKLRMKTSNNITYYTCSNICKPSTSIRKKDLDTLIYKDIGKLITKALEHKDKLTKPIIKELKLHNLPLDLANEVLDTISSIDLTKINLTSLIERIYVERRKSSFLIYITYKRLDSFLL